MSQFDGSETETKKMQNGYPTNGQVILAFLVIVGGVTLLGWIIP